MNNLEQAKKSSAMFYGGIAGSAVVLLVILFLSLYLTQEKTGNHPEILLETMPKNLENTVEVTSRSVASSNNDSDALEKASTLTITKDVTDEEAVTKIQMMKPKLDNKVFTTAKDGLDAVMEAVTEISEKLSGAATKISDAAVDTAAKTEEKICLDEEKIAKVNESIAHTKNEFVNNLLQTKDIQKKVELSDITRYIEFTNRKLVENFLKKAHRGWIFVDTKAYTHSLSLFTKYNLLKDYLKVLNTYSKEEVGKLSTFETRTAKNSELEKARVDLIQLENFAKFLDIVVDCKRKTHKIYFDNFGRQVKFFFKNSFTNTFPKDGKNVIGWNEFFLPRILCIAKPDLAKQSHFDDETYAGFEKLKTEVAQEISKAAERFREAIQAQKDAILATHFSVSQANIAV